MKCEHCGTEVVQGDQFCPNCGAGLSPASEEAPPGDAGAGSNPGRDRISGLEEVAPPTRERKKKLDWKGILYAVLAVVVLVVAIYSCAMDGKMDYVGSVKEYYTPFASLGVDYTCGQVFGRYMPEARWSATEANGVGRVTVSGPLWGAETFEVRFDAEPVPNEEGQAYYSVASGMYDTEILTPEETLQIMETMWEAYDADWTYDDYEMYYGT